MNTIKGTAICLKIALLYLTKIWDKHMILQIRQTSWLNGMNYGQSDRNYLDVIFIFSISNRNLLKARR